jgi:LmbE family N-acetylglucosaminyl deacetylase
MPILRSVTLYVALSLSSVAFGQSMNSSKLLNELHKLKTVGSVLYVAAHPDDENTAMLIYLAQEEKLETAYLSLTRGGGGQNLIGPELKEELGLIRANELLQARKLDGAHQLFTRARDFGYSKNPEDTLENWQEEQVLGDVVYAVRYFKPDIIITRFNPDEGPTHGHHTVSAQLAVKAFSLAADPTQFPEQLALVDVHQAKRIFWNGYGRRGGGSLRDEMREVTSIEIGKYNPYLGESYTEIAAQSRSMHKSQGFGQAGRRGSQIENLVLLAGSPAQGYFLNGVDTSWGRIPGAREVGDLLDKGIREFDPGAPWQVVDDLVEVDRLLARVPQSRQVTAKRTQLQALIAAALGLHFEARSGSDYLTPGDSVELEIEVTNRSPLNLILRGMEASQFDADNWPKSIELARKDGLGISVGENVSDTVLLKFTLSENAPLTQPFWLETEPHTGMYHFKNTRLLEQMSMPPSIVVNATFEISGYQFELATPVIQRVSDPVKGEVHRIVSIRPKVVLEPDASVMLFESDCSKEIEVRVSGNSGTFSGRLEAQAPKGWTVGIPEPNVYLTNQKPEQALIASITPPANASEGTVLFHVVGDDGKSYAMRSNQIEYEHIGRQPLLKKAATKLTRLDLKRGGNRIACIEGVGDPVPETLSRIGYKVDRIQVEDIDKDLLAKYDTVILGPRAFDALEGLDKRFAELSAYVEAGGTLISQFNTTSSRTKSQFTAPYPISLSRDRVSEEKVEMRMLNPEHPVFNIPNKITARDFENWIQERGLYFADSWDEHYEALISANDRGEPPRNGGLLVAPYGRGWYAYTGLSFFRQLPEGNPGAIRFFVNLISLGHGN